MTIEASLQLAKMLLDMNVVSLVRIGDYYSITIEKNDVMDNVKIYLDDLEVI